MLKYLGNQVLLNEYKLGFLCSSRVSSRAILPCYDWATSLPPDSVVVSGFHSPIERDVLQLLLDGGHSVIVVLARRLYATLPTEWQEAYDAGRMLIISTAPEATRVSKPAAALRNEYIARQAEHLVFGYIQEGSSLWACYWKYQNKAELLCIATNNK